jgi:hypothetical protein
MKSSSALAAGGSTRQRRAAGTGTRRAAPARTDEHGRGLCDLADLLVGLHDLLDARDGEL